MLTITVHHAELVPQGGGLWKLSIEVDHDGEITRGGVVMPLDAVEWRVARFNVNKKTALEMILLEQWMAQLLGVDDQTAQREMELKSTRSEARGYQLQRMKDVLDGGEIIWQGGEPPFTISGGEELVVLEDSGDGNPLDLLLEKVPVDDDVIAVKREYLDMHREELQTGNPLHRRLHQVDRLSPEDYRRRLWREASPMNPAEGVPNQPSELARRVLGRRERVVRERRERSG